MGIPTLSQVPPGPNKGAAGPTCDRGFPCTRMWRQTSSRRASPDSILSCGHRNVRPVSGCSRQPLPCLCSSENAKKSLSLQSWSLRAPLVNWAGGGAAKGGRGVWGFFRGGRVRGRKWIGGRERQEGKEAESRVWQLPLTVNWSPERKFGGIFSMWQKK